MNPPVRRRERLIRVNASALVRFDGHEKIEIVIIAIRLTLETHKVELRTHDSANEPPNHDKQTAAPSVITISVICSSARVRGRRLRPRILRLTLLRTRT
jgi:hypothetical protein